MTLTVLQYQVIVGTDDAHESGANTLFDATNAFIDTRSHVTAATRWHSGFRFQGVQLPKGVRVTTATLTLARIGTSVTDSMACDIHAHAHDNSPNFVTDPDVTSRPLTSAFVAWDVANQVADIVSPNISAVIQEIIERAGWAKGNAITILPRGRTTTPTPDEAFRAGGFEQSGLADAAVLDITYASFFGASAVFIG